MPTAKLGDVEIGYETHGDGPPLLVIMGFTGARHHWLGFDRRFSDRYRVISFDNRGVGESTVTRGPYTTAQMAGDALALLDHLEVPKAHVLGVSMGGMIAEELAIAAPSRVERLVLGCTHFGGPNQIGPAPGVHETIARAGKQSAEKTIRDLLELNFTPRFMAEHPDVVEGLVSYGLTARASAFGFWGQSAAIASHDVEARLGSITAPTLVIGGDEDRLVPIENSRVLASLLPNATLVELPGIAHMFWVEAADAAEAAVRRALA